MTRVWSEVPSADVMAYNERVRDAGAPLWQLPFWRAFLERPGLQVRYFAERDTGGGLLAWACVLQWGPRAYRVALVQDGPVNLVDHGGPVPVDSARGLYTALRAQGYKFVRFCTSPQTLPPAAGPAGAIPGDLFPFFSRDVTELHVRLTGVDETLAGFQRHARQHIRRAERRGYRVRSDGDDLLDQVHRIIQMTALRKGFRVPSRETLAGLQAAGSASGGIRLYLAEDPDGQPVSAIVIGADRSTWHYLFGGVDPDRTAGVSPTPLLHWTAMCDAMAAGAGTYNLGADAPASIAAFKEQFRPIRTPRPETVSVTLRPAATAVWRWAALPVLTRLWPSAQRVRHRLWRRNENTTRVAARTA
jgi:Acetyltransferase (GNAT) domain